jgi:hypothetical protein
MRAMGALSVRRVWSMFLGGLGLAATILLFAKFRALIFPPPPNYSIVILGGLAIVLTLLLPKDPGKGQKVTWIVVTCVLVFMEIWADGHDRQKQDQAFAKVLSSIQGGIAETQSDIKQNQLNFVATTIRLQSVREEQDRLRKQMGDSSYENLVRRHTKLKKDIVSLINDIDSLLTSHNVRTEDIITLHFAETDRSKMRLEVPQRLAALNEEDELRYEKQIKPRLLDLLTQVLVATGQDVPNKPKLIETYGISKLDSAMAVARTIEEIDKSVVP